jgi:hypothetical protein
VSHQIATSASDPSAALYWLSACDNAPAIVKTGWIGSQQVAFAPTKNFTQVPHEPGYSAMWSTVGTMVMFTDAKSASAAFTAMEQADDACSQSLPHVGTTASITDGRSWSVTWNPGPIPQFRTYAVQRGPVVELLRVVEAQGEPQPPSYDGSQDTAVLNDMAGHLCAYAGACQ